MYVVRLTFWVVFGEFVAWNTGRAGVSFAWLLLGNAIALGILYVLYRRFEI